MSPTATESEIRMDAAALERLDGAIENAITGIGDANYDKSRSNAPGLPNQLDFDQKGDLYQSSWIVRKICDAYPYEATREWLEVTMGANAEPEAIAKFTKYDQRLKTANAFLYAQTWANIYKGAGIFMIVDDGRPHDQPINRKNVRSIKNLIPLDCNDLRPDTAERFDPLNPDSYMLTRSRRDPDGNDYPNKVHPDRIIRFDGFHLPPKQMQKNQNWGGSLIDSIWDASSRYESSQASVASMVQDYNVFVYGLKGLAELLSSSDDRNLKILTNRLKSLRLTMSNLKGLVMDSEKESASFITRNFAGLSEVLGIFRDELIGAANLPHTVVFGSSPSGMGATGESEEHTWAIQVAQFQKAVFLPKLMPLYELIWLAKDGPTGGKLPEDWSIKFKSLLVQSDKEDAELRSTQSNTDRTYVDMGVLLPEEVRQSRFGGANYTIETTLDEEAWEEKKQQDQFGFGGFGGDMGGAPAADPMADPNAAPAEGEAPAEEAPAPEEPAPTTTDRADGNDPIKRVEKRGGLHIGVTHDPNDIRFGRSLRDTGYGHIRRSYGVAEDGKSIDVYLGPEQSDRLFKVHQVDPQTGFKDETKYCVGFMSAAQARDAVLLNLPRDRFGFIEEVDPNELASYRADCGKDCGCACNAKPEDEPKPKRKRKPKPSGRSLEVVEEEVQEDSPKSDSRSDAKGKRCGNGWTSAKNQCRVKPTTQLKQTSPDPRANAKPANTPDLGKAAMIAGGVALGAAAIGAGVAIASQGRGKSQQSEDVYPPKNGPRPPLEINSFHLQSRGVSADYEYSWEGSDGIPPKFISEYADLIDSQSPTVAVIRKEGKLGLWITGMDSGRVDFRGRGIRNSIAITVDDKHEEAVRAIASKALRGELDAELASSIANGSDGGISIDEKAIKSLLSSTPEVAANDAPSLRPSASKASKEDPQLHQQKRNELADELENSALPKRDGPLVVSTGVTTKKKHEAAQVWRSIGRYADVKNDAAEDDKDLGDYLLEDATKAATPIVKSWLRDIKAFISAQRESGSSLEQVSDRLPELFNQLDGDRFAEVLYQKSVLANLGGRDEVLND